MVDQKFDINEIDKTLKADFLTDIHESELGKVDRYKIARRLGSGGFGAVFLARDTVADVLVALKVLPPEIARVPEELENVRSNFALVSRLHHHNIAGLLYLHQIEAVDQIASELLQAEKGAYLVVMEYIEGVTLAELQKQYLDKKLPLDQAVKIARQIAEALDYAHRQKIIHRDIKPANIMIQADNTVKVLDFGLAYEIHSSMSRVTMELEKNSAGTPNYMAPEQWAGNRLTERCDQYALACVFYELVCGDVPFASAFSTNNFRIIMNVIAHKECEPLRTLASTQNAAIRKAMNKDPKKRFDSCTEFVDVLQGEKSHSFKNKLWLGAAVVLVLLIAAAPVIWALSRKKTEERSKSSTLKNTLIAGKSSKSNSTPSKPVEAVEKSGQISKASTAAKAFASAGQTAVKRPIPGRNWEVPDSGGMKMIWVRPGTIKVVNPGNNFSLVRNPSGFWLAQTEVTVGQFMQFLREAGSTPEVAWNNPQCPVKMEGNEPFLNDKVPGNSLDNPMTCVTVRGVILYCIWLNKRERQAGRLPLKHQYHIPGLDLFEYAFAVGGKSNIMTIDVANKMITGDTCWNKENSGGMLHAVGTSKPNYTGIYDLTGNVQEISVDVWASLKSSKLQKSGTKFVLFGTSWNGKLPDFNSLVTEYSRSKTGPEVGFRVSLGLIL